MVIMLCFLFRKQVEKGCHGVHPLFSLPGSQRALSLALTVEESGENVNGAVTVV